MEETTHKPELVLYTPSQEANTKCRSESREGTHACWDQQEKKSVWPDFHLLITQRLQQSAPNASENDYSCEARLIKGACINNI